MMNKKTIFLVCLVLLVSGCITTGPSRNTGFTRITDLNELNGIYANLGEGQTAARYVYLSEIIWPRADMDHSRIDAIDVRAIDVKTLFIKALRKGTVIREAAFVQGRDFELEGGAIRLLTELSFVNASRRTGYPAPNYQRIELGIDKEGHGKYRESELATGLVWLNGTTGFRDDVKFEKIGK
ncbi:MAG TPA: hypothetical protein VN604_08970 [Nitrospirota bacterium]|nr:hypothetical protein [Nitrospirota bacterium]